MQHSDKLRFAYKDYQIGSECFHIRSLHDPQQYADPEGVARRMGISPGNWSLFGVVWPSGQMLARLMGTYAIDGLRILEVGCGLALASLVLQRRGAYITVSDYHPEMPMFLKNNTMLNDLSDITVIGGDWNDEGQVTERFDLIIGSDLLYERGHHDQLSTFIDRHAKAEASVIIIDPNRGHVGKFNRRMAALGYECSESPARAELADSKPYRGRILCYRRSQAPVL
jgi:predicted nicotinamide N-methyase